MTECLFVAQRRFYSTNPRCAARGALHNGALLASRSATTMLRVATGTTAPARKPGCLAAEAAATGSNARLRGLVRPHRRPLRTRSRARPRHGVRMEPVSQNDTSPPRELGRRHGRGCCQHPAGEPAAAGPPAGLRPRRRTQPGVGAGRRAAQSAPVARLQSPATPPADHDVAPPRELGLRHGRGCCQHPAAERRAGRASGRASAGADASGPARAGGRPARSAPVARLQSPATPPGPKTYVAPPPRATTLDRHSAPCYTAVYTTLGRTA